MLHLVIALALAGAEESDVSVGDLVERVGPSIVRLGTFQGEDQLGNGTGFFVREDGIAVTNHHVVDHASSGELLAIFADGTRRKVLGVLADDEEHDIAIIKVEGAGYPPLALADATKLTVGERVVIIGSSSGLDQSLGVGVISALRDELPKEWKQKRLRLGDDKETKGPLVQHTATSGPGSSGSPLINLRGEVVGVQHSGVPESGMAFAARVDLLQALLARTDLSATPKPLGVGVRGNLLISLGAFAAIGLLVASFPIAQRISKRRRASERN